MYQQNWLIFLTINQLLLYYYYSR